MVGQPVLLTNDAFSPYTPFYRGEKISDDVIQPKYFAGDRLKRRNVCRNEGFMSDFSINEMQEMQKKLQNRYRDKWEPISPETGKNKMLWMIGEIGEVIDIVKKNGGSRASVDKKLRGELIEELADVLMYYNDILLCYGISAKELKQAYVEKHEKNMERW